MLGDRSRGCCRDPSEGDSSLACRPGDHSFIWPSIQLGLSGLRATVKACGWCTEQDDEASILMKLRFSWGKM